MHGEVIHPLCTGLCTSFKTDQSELTAYLYNDNLEDTKKKKKSLLQGRDEDDLCGPLHKIACKKAIQGR